MVNEKRLIDANAFKIFLEEVRQDYLEEDTFSSDFAAKVIETVQDEYLANAPTVDAVEVVHGRWEQVQIWATKAKYRCSVCGREIMSAVKVNIEKYPYCHCGAKMDGDGNGCI